MYARVVRFTGADAASVAQAVANIESQPGPPEGVPAKALKFLFDESSGTVVAIAFFDTEEDMRKGDETLSAMDPPSGPVGARASVDLCEIKLEVEAP
jgi:hypothetical protein